jgi:hypothetical protein
LCGLREYYFFTGAAGAVAVGADAGAVEVTADCAAGFGACCCWHPAKAKTATLARAAMIAEILITFSPPFFLIVNNSSALVTPRIKRYEKLSNYNMFP